jgi:DNA-binding NarL/FixJ family response regulator
MPKLEQRPEFKRLSFNKLRKTAINAIREIAGGEVAGVFACHGQPVQTDNLIDLYSNRDYAKVIEACRLWGERLAAMFASVPSPFEQAKRRHRKASSYLSKRGEVLKLRDEGKTLRQIAALAGISFRAVRHHVANAPQAAGRDDEND